MAELTSEHATVAKALCAEAADLRAGSLTAQLCGLSLVT